MYLQQNTIFYYKIGFFEGYSKSLLLSIVFVPTYVKNVEVGIIDKIPCV